MCRLIICSNNTAQYALHGGLVHRIAARRQLPLPRHVVGIDECVKLRPSHGQEGLAGQGKLGGGSQGGHVHVVCAGVERGAFFPLGPLLRPLDAACVRYDGYDGVIIGTYARVLLKEAAVASSFWNGVVLVRGDSRSMYD